MKEVRWWSRRPKASPAPWWSPWTPRCWWSLQEIFHPAGAFAWTAESPASSPLHRCILTDLVRQGHNLLPASRTLHMDFRLKTHQLRRDEVWPEAGGRSTPRRGRWGSARTGRRWWPPGVPRVPGGPSSSAALEGRGAAPPAGPTDGAQPTASSRLRLATSVTWSASRLDLRLARLDRQEAPGLQGGLPLPARTTTVGGQTGPPCGQDRRQPWHAQR